MKGYIPKQPKQIKERIEAKLDSRLVHQLEQYCEYLESDREYVISQALAIAFKRDKGFADWLGRQPATAAQETTDAIGISRRGRKSQREAAGDKNGNSAALPLASLQTR